MATKIQLKRGEYAYWITNEGTNTILERGEVAVSYNTPINGVNRTMFKIGDGLTAWAQLPFKGMESYNDLKDLPKLNNSILESSITVTSNFIISDGGGSW